MADGVGLLPFDLVVKQLSTLRVGREPAATRALVVLSDWLTNRRHDTSVPAPTDRAALAAIAEAVEQLDGALSGRMNRRPVHFSAAADPNSRRFVSPAVDYRRAGRDWKPLDVLWTAPAVDAVESDWSIWAAHSGETAAARLREDFDRPVARHVCLLSSLAEADGVVDRYGTVAAALRLLRRGGIQVVDFSWRCVLEAEIAAFRGQRSPVAFPCGLGTACSLWLEVPTETSQTWLRREPSEDAPPPAGWFTYGGE